MLPTGRYATAKTEIAVGLLMGSLIVSASKGELVLSFGSSDSKMKGVSVGLVMTADWVAVRFWVSRRGDTCECGQFE